MSEDIKYRKPSMKYIEYYEDDRIIVARVLKQVGPTQYLIHVYSEATGINGEQEVADLNYLDCENGFERISFEEFNSQIQNLNVDSQ